MIAPHAVGGARGMKKGVHSPEPMMLPTMTVMPLRRLILASSLISPPPASPPAAAGFSSPSPLLDTDLRDTSVADMLAACTPAADWARAAKRVCESRSLRRWGSMRRRSRRGPELCERQGRAGRARTPAHSHTHQTGWQPPGEHHHALSQLRRLGEGEVEEGALP